MTEKLWDGRFAEKTHHSVEAFTSSIAFDSRLYTYDIAGSVAHCRMLAKTGIIADETAFTLVEGLGKIQREIERGEFTFDDSLEDIHMHIEARLLQLVGKAAQELHTARSRNDQVALDVRMYLRMETADIVRGLTALRRPSSRWPRRPRWTSSCRVHPHAAGPAGSFGPPPHGLF
jgi:argininosuccinate lyase